MQQNQESIFITGASGFLGLNAAKYFKNRNFYVVGTDVVDCLPNNQEIFNKYFISDLTIFNPNLLSSSYNLVLHCAGASSVGRSINNPYIDYINTNNTLFNILENIRLNSPKSVFIYPSSAAVYGKKESMPIYETDILNPISPYGFNKKLAENICLMYSNLYKIHISIIRYFSIYGPGLTKQIFWDALKKLNSEDYNIFFSGTGDETRDWIYIDDAISLIDFIYKQNNNFAIFNAGIGQQRTIKDALNILNNISKSNKKISFDNLVRIGDPLHYLANINLALSTGWKPTIDLEEGLQNYFNWYKVFK